MTRIRLMDLLLRAVAISEGQRLILAGGQALYAVTSSPPEVVERSEEADLLLVMTGRLLFERIEAELGMRSDYLVQTGVFAHPVGLGTISLPRGWEPRLVAFGGDEGLENVWALEVHDLAASKLMAGREKDFGFLIEAHRREFLSLETLLDRFCDFRRGAFRNAVEHRLGKLESALESARLSPEARLVRN